MNGNDIKWARAAVAAWLEMLALKMRGEAIAALAAAARLEDKR